MGDGSCAEAVSREWRREERVPVDSSTEGETAEAGEICKGGFSTFNHEGVLLAVTAAAAGCGAGSRSGESLIFFTER